MYSLSELSLYFGRTYLLFLDRRDPTTSTYAGICTWKKPNSGQSKGSTKRRKERQRLEGQTSGRGGAAVRTSVRCRPGEGLFRTRLKSSLLNPGNQLCNTHPAPVPPEPTQALRIPPRGDAGGAKQGHEGSGPVTRTSDSCGKARATDGHERPPSPGAREMSGPRRPRPATGGHQAQETAASDGLDRPPGIARAAGRWEGGNASPGRGGSVRRPRPARNSPHSGAGSPRPFNRGAAKIWALRTAEGRGVHRGHYPAMDRRRCRVPLGSGGGPGRVTRRGRGQGRPRTAQMAGARSGGRRTVQSILDEESRRRHGNHHPDILPIFGLLSCRAVEVRF